MSPLVHQQWNSTPKLVVLEDQAQLPQLPFWTDADETPDHLDQALVSIFSIFA